MMLFLQAAAAAPHPLDGTSAEWIWLVLALPLIGMLINGVFTAMSEWRPGPYDPDAKHWGHRDVGFRGEHLTRSQLKGVTDEMRAIVETARDAGHATTATITADHETIREEPHAERHRFFFPVSIVGAVVLGRRAKA